MKRNALTFLSIILSGRLGRICSNDKKKRRDGVNTVST